MTIAPVTVTPLDWRYMTSKPEITCGDSGYATLDAILANAAVTSGVVVVSDTQTLDASSNRTLKAGLTLRVLQGGTIVVPTGRTFTTNGLIEAGDYTIFTLQGTGTVAVSGKTPEWKLRWYGCTGDGTTDDSTAFLNALNVLSYGRKLVGTPGDTYLIKVTKTFSATANPTNFDLRGAAIKPVGTPTVPVRQTISGISLADPAVITMSAAHGLSAGDSVRFGGISQEGWRDLNGTIWTVKTTPAADTMTLWIFGADSGTIVFKSATALVDTLPAYTDATGFLYEWDRANYALHTINSTPMTLENAKFTGQLVDCYISYGHTSEPTSFTVAGADVMGNQQANLIDVDTNHYWYYDAAADAVVLCCTDTGLGTANQEYPDTVHSAAGGTVIDTVAVEDWQQFKVGVGLWTGQLGAGGSVGIGFGTKNTQFDDFDIGYFLAGTEFNQQNMVSLNRCGTGIYAATVFGGTLTGIDFNTVHGSGCEDNILQVGGLGNSYTNLVFEAHDRDISIVNPGNSIGGTSGNSITNWSNEGQNILIRPFHGPSTGSIEVGIFSYCNPLIINGSFPNAGGGYTIGSADYMFTIWRSKLIVNGSYLNVDQSNTTSDGLTKKDCFLYRADVGSSLALNDCFLNLDRGDTNGTRIARFTGCQMSINQAIGMRDGFLRKTDIDFYADWVVDPILNGSGLTLTVVDGDGSAIAYDATSHLGDQSIKCTLAGDSPTVRIASPVSTVTGTGSGYSIARLVMKADGVYAVNIAFANGPSAYFTVNTDWVIYYLNGYYLTAYPMNMSSLDVSRIGTGLSAGIIYIGNIQVASFDTEYERAYWIGAME